MEAVPALLVAGLVQSRAAVPAGLRSAAAGSRIGTVVFGEAVRTRAKASGSCSRRPRSDGAIKPIERGTALGHDTRPDVFGWDAWVQALTVHRHHDQTDLLAGFGPPAT
jgi:hypothetical protein